MGAQCIVDRSHTGTRLEAASFYFRLYDTDDSGIVEHRELTQVLRQNLETFERRRSEALAILRRYDLDGNRTLSATEFERSMMREPKMAEFFGRVFGLEA